nr:hypothetical protein [uncultured Rhodopila sp.]
MSPGLPTAALVLCVLAAPAMHPAYAQYGQYVGQMTMIYDESGGTNRYKSTHEVLVSIQEPYKIPTQYGPTTGTGDTNPLFLYVTDLETTVNIQPGGLHVVSATPQVGGGSTGEPAGLWVMQSWKLQPTANGFTGSFDNALPVDNNNLFVSLEADNPLAFDLAAMANGGNPFGGNQLVACIAYISKVTTVAAVFDTAEKSIQMTFNGHGGGYMKGICTSDIAFQATISATLDPAVAAPQPQLTPPVAH